MPAQTNPYECKPISDVLAEFKLEAAVGLADADIQARQKTYSLNEVPEKHPSFILLFLKHFRGLTAFMLEFTIIEPLWIYRSATISGGKHAVLFPDLRPSD